MRRAETDPRARAANATRVAFAARFAGMANPALAHFKGRYSGDFPAQKVAQLVEIPEHAPRENGAHKQSVMRRIARQRKAWMELERKFAAAWDTYIQFGVDALNRELDEFIGTPNAVRQDSEADME